MARKRIACDATLGGRGLAKAGLIVGYVALGINVLVVLALVGFFLVFGARLARQVSVPPGQTAPIMRAERPRLPAAPAAETGPTDTSPDAAGWTLQLQSASIPAGPVTGRIKGRNFDLEQASLENGWLKFRQGADFFADLEIDIVLFVNSIPELSGKTFTVPKQEFGGNPHIWMKWKADGASVPEQKSWMEGYAMQLEFGPAADGKLPGKIYLCLPDAEKSFIRGTFEASLKAEAGSGVPTPKRKARTRSKGN